MAHPNPRPLETEEKNFRRDFLSLYREPSCQHQDPRSASQDCYAKTQDFFKPLEGGKDYVSKEGKDEISKQKFSLVQPVVSREEVLVQPMVLREDTYNIDCVSTFDSSTMNCERNISQASCTKRKMEIDSINIGYKPYNGSTFTLWEDSFSKDQVGKQLRQELSRKLGHWSPERSPIVALNCTAGECDDVLKSHASSKQQRSGQQRDQGFIEMMKSIRSGLPGEEDDDHEKYVDKEIFSQTVSAGVKSDGKGNDERVATPRSKHSATEQRRRSKINDRFQILRELIPHSDQKRDKASFLLEVIEYIQFLQEKVHKYETAFPGWSPETGAKLMPWKHSNMPSELVNEHTRIMTNGIGPGLMLTEKFEESNLAVSAATPATTQSLSESDMSTALSYRPIDYDHSGLTSKGVSLPLQQHSQNMFGSSFIRSIGGLAHPSQRLIADTESMTQQWQRPSDAESDLLEQEELTIDGGTIRMSSIYSQGLLNSFTNALQSSGIDLSQAYISVQIDLGKRVQRPVMSAVKDFENPTSSVRSRVASNTDNSIHAQKRIRVDTS